MVDSKTLQIQLTEIVTYFAYYRLVYWVNSQLWAPVVGQTTTGGLQWLPQLLKFKLGYEDEGL